MYHFGTIREFQMPLFLQEVFFFPIFQFAGFKQLFERGFRFNRTRITPGTVFRTRLPLNIKIEYQISGTKKNFYCVINIKTIT